MFAIWLVLSYDLLGEDRRIDDVTNHNVLLLYYVKQIDAMFVNRIREMVSFEPVESLWLSGRASEHGIRMSEVRFPMGTQNLFFISRSWQDKKHLPLDSMLSCICLEIDNRRHKMCWEHQWHTRLRFVVHFFVLTTLWHHLWSITEQTQQHRFLLFFT